MRTKWCKAFVGFLLLPVCWGAINALFQVLRASRAADLVWIPILAGAACWGAIYGLLPRPMWLYVVGHELTHVLWTWMSGGQVTRFRASSEGGHVLVTKSNFLVALAPYFFPFYAVVVVVVFDAGNLLWGWSGYRVWFHLLLGAAYAFHVTLTWQILRIRQSDITSQGYLFSAVVIFLGNVVVLMLAVPLLTGQSDWWQGFQWWWQETVRSLAKLGQWIVPRLRGLHL